MKYILIDSRPTQLLDKRQRGIGIYANQLIKNIRKKRDQRIRYHYLSLHIEKLFSKYSPKNKLHVLVKKIQLLYWLIDNAFLELRIPSSSIFHSLDQFYIPRRGAFKRVVTIHDLVPYLFQKQYLIHLNPIMRKFYLDSLSRLSSVNHIIAVSNFTKNDIIKNFKIDEQKISVVYEGVNPTFKLYHETKYKRLLFSNLKLPKKFILYVGGIDPRKNCESVIRVFKNLVTRFKDLYLIIVGSDFFNYEDPAKKGIDNLIKRHSLGEKIIALGYVDDLTLGYLYNAAQLLLFPSFYEGFGLPVIEAFSCGCPVIASNLTCLPEITSNSAILINPKNIQEITKATQRVLEDKSLANNLKMRGLKRAHYFSWEKAAHQTIKTYNQLSE